MNTDSVDLIATDPPFNKGRDFHATPDSLADGAKFQDRWKWSKDVHEEWVDQLQDDHPAAWAVIDWSRMTYGDDMGAFLCFMAVRLLEMHRVLKPTGSIYLHCDPTASHYLKALMDAIFGRKNFRNEIVWQKIRSSKAQKAGFGPVHDIILFYRAGPNARFENVYTPLPPERIAKHYAKTEDGTGRRYGLYDFTQSGQGNPRRFGDRILPPPAGKHWIWDQARIDRAWAEGRLVFTSENMVRVKRYLDESKGNPVEDIWVDIAPINAVSRERVGYPTQKPLPLYERMILASSKRGDMVLDPFAGCATTCVAAERQGRQWVGIDIWKKAHEVVRARMKNDLETHQFTFTGDFPERTDSGETAARYLPTIEKRVLPLEPWQRLSRTQIVQELTEAQSVTEGLVLCAGCGRELEPPFMELDHIRPRADGGENDISNRILLCRPCNGRKSAKLTMPGLHDKNRKERWMKDAAFARHARALAKERYEEVRYRRRWPAVDTTGNLL